MNDTEENYTEPSLEEYGTARNITKGVGAGSILDGDYEEGTPEDELGFSPEE